MTIPLGEEVKGNFLAPETLFGNPKGYFILDISESIQKKRGIRKRITPLPAGHFFLQRK
jgi:hypothetical protein